MQLRLSAKLRDHLREYKETRNGLLGADYSSKFSPWLNEGCLSPRSLDQRRRLRALKQRLGQGEDDDAIHRAIIALCDE